MKRIKIFISSVQSEFAQERAMLCNYIRTDVLLGKFFEPFIFEEVPANELSASSVYLREVEQCDIYLGLLGNLYGYEDKEGISPTEREYDLASSLHKSRLIYIKSVEEEQRHKKEIAFIQKVEQDIVRKTFVDIDGLRTSVYASLIRYLEEKDYIRWRPFDASNDNGATLDDLDEEKIKNFIYMARSKRNFPLPIETPPITLLAHLDLIDEKGRLSNAAILLFGKKPQKYFITSEVKCVQFYGNVVEKPMPSYQIYRGDVFELVNQATSFVMSRIDNWVGTRSQGENAEVPTHPELPIEAVKEAIVNAICHRDYTSNASVQVMLFKDRLEILNPGTLPYGLTVQKLHGPHKSLPTNPLLADPMYWSGYIEKVGTGTEDIINQCEKYGLKTPEFQQDEDFKVIIWRSSASESDPDVIQIDPEVIQIDPDVVNKEDSARLVVLLRENPSISRTKLSKELGISERKVRNIMDGLRSTGYLVREGSYNHGQWVLNDPGEEYKKSE
jgi:predicted HTH transcriptional regulator